MEYPHEFMLEKAKCRDRQYDGRFITGVLTTKVYCLPSCSAKQPLDRNIRFFASEADAREAGLRPCRRCRPDHFYRNYDPDEALISALVERMKTKLATLHCLDDVAILAGVSPTKLHQLFRKYFHQTPMAFLNRLRVANASALLESTDSSLLAIQASVGFRQSSTFHHSFIQQVCLSPGRYRKLPQLAHYAIELPDNYRPELVTPYWLRDADNLIFQRRNGWFWRTFQVGNASCLIRARFASGRFEIHPEVAPDYLNVFALHDQILRILGLPADPKPFENKIRNMDMENIIHGGQGLRVPGTPTVYEALVWTILGQQINLAFAYRLRNRLIQMAGVALGNGHYAHPTPAAVAKIDLQTLLDQQFSRRKGEYLIGLSKRICEGGLDLEGLRAKPITQVERQLEAERGIGRWTARYVAMRGCGFGDCTPVGDAGLRRALREYHQLDTAPDADQTEALMAAFQPYRSLATFHLWRYLKPLGSKVNLQKKALAEKAT